jgi:GPH family glycoside/pentoside/hexuronide:cation symporter
LLFYESIGASLLYLSFFVAMARATEIILKPIVAHLSDKLNTIYGRRKPFMIISCFFYAFFLVMIFQPPSMKAEGKYISIYFGFFYTLFFIADTFANIPYLALGPELSTNSRERESLYLFIYIFQYIGVLFAAAAPVVLNKLYPVYKLYFIIFFIFF